MSPSSDDAPMGEQAEREERTGKMFLARLHSCDLAGQDIIIRNISAHGLGARSKGAIPHPNDAVRIEMEAYGSVEGVVRWVKGNLFGVELTSALNPELLNFSGKAWDVVNKPFDSGQVYRQFKPEQSCKRPALKAR